MMTATGVRNIQLDDGRHIAFAEYGDPDGHPLFLCHGWPGSRIEGALLATTAARHHVRLIAPDRPGSGLSDPLPGRRLLDWPRDLARLADALDIGRFAVLGASGGGPHALACAQAIPDRLTHTLILGGMGPQDVPCATDYFEFQARMGYTLIRRMPRLGEWLMAQLFGDARRDPAAYLARMADRAPAPDRAVLDRPAIRRILADDLTEALRQGFAGVAHEASLLASPWGFELSAVRARVDLWQGELDPSIPVSMGRYLAIALPNCRATFYRDEGHLSLLVDRADAALATVAHT